MDKDDLYKLCIFKTNTNDIIIHLGFQMYDTSAVLVLVGLGVSIFACKFDFSKIKWSRESRDYSWINCGYGVMTFNE